MKKYLISILLMSFCLASNSQTVMTIAGNDITKQEYEYYYNKNLSGDNIKMDKKEYLEKFINFKLKVQEAYERSMDTVSSFKRELNGYRDQLITPYLTDQKKTEELIKEEYSRMLEDVNVSHILFRVSMGGDTIEAYNRAQTALKRLKKESFESVAATMSEDPSMLGDSGRIGWITGLSTVYPFETAAYNTPVGSTSGLIKTIFGYHIIKVNDRRISRGQVKVAHIFIRKKEDMTQRQLDSTKNEVEKIYNQIKSNKITFSAAAKKYSEDGTAQKGGELPWITTGKTNDQFEDAAFALKEVGDISEPIDVPYGWHIISLIDKKPIDSLEDMHQMIESRIMSDERAMIINQSLINNLKDYYQFRQVKSKDTLAIFANVVLTKDSLQKFIDDNANIGQDTLEMFFNTTLFNYEKNHLEERYPEFGLLMKEYKDGILMFNISQQEIWNKAAKDTAGMRQYFEANKEKYAWNKPHYKGIIVHCKDKDTKKKAKRLVSSVKKGSTYECLTNLNTNKKKVVKMERGVYAEGKNPYIDFLVFKKGKLPENKTYPEVFATGKKLKQPEAYTDVRGSVLNDYQNVVEEAWIKRLRDKYPVIVYQNILDTIE